MDAVTVVVKLNPQQRELLDKTIARGAAPDLEALIRRALREQAASHGAVKVGDASAVKVGDASAVKVGDASAVKVGDASAAGAPSGSTK